MDGALALNAIRDYDKRDRYDVIIYDGNSDLDTLRIFGIAEIGSWYFRRFRNVFETSDIAKALSPFVQPISSAVLSVDFSQTQFSSSKLDALLDEGQAAIRDASKVAAFLVTTPREADQALATYRWGQAQMIGLTIGGVLLNQASSASPAADRFQPLPITAIPTLSGNGTENDWDAAIAALPDFAAQAQQAPKPITINLTSKTVKLFLPGFTKKQVKLIQSGPEVTIEAGGQRRNILLPAGLQGRSVTGAKFNEQYLTIAF